MTGRPASEGELPDVSWYSAYGTAVDWHGGDMVLCCLLKAPEPDQDPEGLGRNVLLLVNATTESREFIVPPVAKGLPWRQFIDTAEASPYDIYPQLDGPRLPDSGRLTVPYRSLCCYVAERG